jgi:hypothetical protein
VQIAHHKEYITKARKKLMHVTSNVSNCERISCFLAGSERGCGIGEEAAAGGSAGAGAKGAESAGAAEKGRAACKQEEYGLNSTLTTRTSNVLTVVATIARGGFDCMCTN